MPFLSSKQEDARHRHQLHFLQAFAFTTSQIVPHFDELMRITVADVMTEAVVHVEPAAP